MPVDILRDEAYLYLSMKVESIERQQEQYSTVTLLALFTLSEKDKAEGRVFSKQQVLAELAD